MKKYSQWLFPLTLLSFIGPTIFYLSRILSTRERWLFLGLLALQQLLVRRRPIGNQGFVFFLFLYATWCITTTFWSEVYELSLYKSILFFVVAFTMVYAGHNWVTRQGAGKCFDYMVPVAVIAYSAGIPGYFFSPSPYVGNFYQGLVNGSNMLGSLMYMSAPIVFWRLYVDWGNIRRRRCLILLCISSFVIIYMTHSRSSLLVALTILGGVLLSLKVKKQIMIAYFAVLLFTLGSLIFHEEGSSIIQQLLYKNSETIIFSRLDPWSKSLEKAILGEWIGGGYGVSIGDDSWKGGSFTSFGYGREKGNTQMAIIEETGVVGLVLYVMMLCSLFFYLFTKFLTIVDKDTRTALGIFMGALTGMVLQTVFEAWWVAPGSPESPLFWALAGAALGLVDQERDKARRHSAQAWSRNQS